MPRKFTCKRLYQPNFCITICSIFISIINRRAFLYYRSNIYLDLDIFVIILHIFKSYLINLIKTKYKIYLCYFKDIYPINIYKKNQRILQ